MSEELTCDNCQRGGHTAHNCPRPIVKRGSVSHAPLQSTDAIDFPTEFLQPPPLVQSHVETIRDISTTRSPTKPIPTRPSPPRKPIRIPGAERGICYDYLKGVCSRGDTCKFAHIPKGTGICFDFQRKTCRKGDDCPFVHVKLGDLAFDDISVSELQARGICYDFQRSMCHRGKDCRYCHVSVSVPRSDKPCYDYLKGKCTRGDSCRFSHTLDTPSPRSAHDPESSFSARCSPDGRDGRLTPDTARSTASSDHHYSLTAPQDPHILGSIRERTLSPSPTKNGDSPAAVGASRTPRATSPLITAALPLDHVIPSPSAIRRMSDGHTSAEKPPRSMPSPFSTPPLRGLEHDSPIHSLPALDQDVGADGHSMNEASPPVTTLGGVALPRRRSNSAAGAIGKSPQSAKSTQSVPSPQFTALPPPVVLPASGVREGEPGSFGLQSLSMEDRPVPSPARTAGGVSPTQHFGPPVPVGMFPGPEEQSVAMPNSRSPVTMGAEGVPPQGYHHPQTVYQHLRADPSTSPHMMPQQPNSGQYVYPTPYPAYTAGSGVSKDRVLSEFQGPTLVYPNVPMDPNVDPNVPRHPYSRSPQHHPHPHPHPHPYPWPPQQHPGMP
eukprot:Rmarinus@m.18349